MGEFTTRPTSCRQVRIPPETPERSLAGHMGAMKLSSCFLSSDDPGVMQPNVQRSTGSSATQLVSFPLFFTGVLVLLVSMLH